MQSRRQQGLIATLAMAGSLIMAGCSDQRNMPECGDVIESRLDKSGYEVLEDGIALHRETGLKVTQCAVGQRMSNFRCRGESLKLTCHNASSLS